MNEKTETNHALVYRKIDPLKQFESAIYFIVEFKIDWF